MKMFAVVMGAMFAMSAGACGGKKEEGGGGGGGGGDVPAACQKYMDTMKACMGKMPEASRGAMENGFKQATEAWKGMDKGALEGACKAAMDAAKGSMAQMCPDVKWE